MNKKLLYTIATVVVLLVAVSLVWLFISQNSSKSKTNQGMSLAAISVKQARGLRHTASCVGNNPATKATVEALPGLGENSGIYTEEIYDVPAGTNVDVSIATYDSPSYTLGGSLTYSNEYGRYNFLLQKQSDGWRYVAFIRCG